MLTDTKFFYLYKITNVLDGKVYIGQTVHIETRWKEHQWAARQNEPSQYVHRAIKKYGIENFVFEVVATCISLDSVNVIEQILIQQYNSHDNNYGYNVAMGGRSAINAGRSLSEEHKRRIGEANTGRKATPETIKKQSDAQKGKPKSEEFKKRVSETQKGRVFSDETLQKMSDAQKGRPKSEAHKKSMSECRLGKPSNAAKLTDTQVIAIRVDPRSARIIAQDYMVSSDAIFDIRAGRTYKHV